MALSGATNIRVRTEGIPSALMLLRSVPDRIVPPTVEDVVDDIVRLGVDLMSINIINSIRTDKSTGVLAESIQGTKERIAGTPGQSDGAWAVEIGSALPYAKYVAREIGLSTINRNVLIQPGKWRWIGIRAPIPAHPFLEQTMEDLNKILPGSLHGYFSRYVMEVQRDVDALERES